MIQTLLPRQNRSGPASNLVPGGQALQPRGPRSAVNVGDRVEILPEFQDQGDDAYEWVVVGAEEKGRLDISPAGTSLDGFMYVCLLQ